MPAKPQAANRKKGRKRNRSSQAQQSLLKKYKTKTDSDSDESIYFELDNSDSEFENSSDKNTPPTPSSSEKMASTFSKDDLKELGKLIVQEIKVDIVKELKIEFKLFVEKESIKLKNEIASLKDENTKLSKALKSTKLELDELEQYGRRMCLDISGIKGDTRDSSENVEKKLIECAEKIGLDLSPHDIDRCHRKGKPKHDKNRKVIVKFTNSKARERVYRARKTLGDGIYVQDNLTIFREKLSYEARQLVRAKLLAKTWVAGCKIYGILLSIPKPFVIKDMDTIECIKEGRPLPEPEDTAE